MKGTSVLANDVDMSIRAISAEIRDFAIGISIDGDIDEMYTIGIRALPLDRSVGKGEKPCRVEEETEDLIYFAKDEIDLKPGKWLSQHQTVSFSLFLFNT